MERARVAARLVVCDRTRSAAFAVSLFARIAVARPGGAHDVPRRAGRNAARRDVRSRAEPTLRQVSGRRDGGARRLLRSGAQSRGRTGPLWRVRCRPQRSRRLRHAAADAARHRRERRNGRGSVSGASGARGSPKRAGARQRGRPGLRGSRARRPAAGPARKSRAFSGSMRRATAPSARSRSCARTVRRSPVRSICIAARANPRSGSPDAIIRSSRSRSRHVCRDSRSSRPRSAAG